MRGIESFEDLSTSLDVTLCRACAEGSTVKHQKGWADPSTGTVHYGVHSASRLSLRRYLKLVAAIYYSHNRGQPTWQMLYEQNQFAYSTAKRLGIRIPSVLADTDRAHAAEAMFRAGTKPSRELQRWIRQRDR
jgi:hypothetical protein